VLNIERQSYLTQFEAGSLSAEAYEMLEMWMSDLAADAKDIEMHGDDVDASFCGRDSQNGALPATVPEESEGGTSAPPVRIKHANVAAESSKDLAKARQSKLGAVLYSRNTTLREKRIKAHEKLQAAFRAAQAEVTEIEKKRVERTLKRLPVNQRGSFKERMDLEMAKRSSSGELVEKPLLQKEHTRNDGNLSEAQRLSDFYDWRFYVLMERLVRKKTSFDVKVAYEVGLGYLEALDEVEHAMSMKTSTAMQAEHGTIFRMIAREHKDNREACLKTLEMLQRRYPPLIHEWKSSRVAAQLLLKQRSTLHHLLHEGALMDLDFATLSGKVEQHLKRLYLAPLIQRIRLAFHRIPEKYRQPVEIGAEKGIKTFQAVANKAHETAAQLRAGRTRQKAHHTAVVHAAKLSSAAARARARTDVRVRPEPPANNSPRQQQDNEN